VRRIIFKKQIQHLGVIKPFSKPIKTLSYILFSIRNNQKAKFSTVISILYSLPFAINC